MLKRLVYAAVGVVGVLLIGLAIASATVWRAGDVLHASAKADQPIVVTDPGVLEMAGNPVTITATVPAGDSVSLAVGRDTDVTGWVGTDPHQRVSGLASWSALALAAPAPAASTPAPPATSAATTSAATTSAAPTGAAPTSAAPGPVPSGSAVPGAGGSAGSSAPVPDPRSDMWVAQAQGTGSATLTWRAQPGRWSLLVVGTTSSGSAAPPTLALAWPRTVTTPYLVPGSVAGGLLVLASLFLFWRELRHRRGGADWTPVLTEAIPVVAGAGGVRPALTRRQMRELLVQARTGQIAVVQAGAPATGPLPVVGRREAGGEPTASGTPLARRLQVAQKDVATVGGPTVPPSGRTVPPDERTIAPSEHAARRDQTRIPLVEQGLRSDRRAAEPAEPAPGPPVVPARPAAVPAGPAATPARLAPPSESEGARHEPVAPPEPATAEVPLVPQVASADHEQASPQVAPAPDRPAVNAPIPGGRRSRRQATSSPADEAAPYVSAPPPPAGAPSAPPVSTFSSSGRWAWAPEGATAAAVPAPPAPAPAAAASAAPAPAQPASAPAAARTPSDQPGRPTWMRPRPAAPTPAASAAAPEVEPVRSAAGAPGHAPEPAAAGLAPRASGHGPAGQPAWLARVTAGSEPEDATRALEEHPGRRPAEPEAGVTTPPAPSSSGGSSGEQEGRGDGQPAEQDEALPEPSRADAWRRAWGLPPLDAEKDDR